MESELTYPSALNDHDLDQQFPEQVIKSKIRGSISELVGDTDSLLGTHADSTHLLLYAFSQLTVALNQAKSLAEVRQAAAPFNELATDFLNKVDSGEVKLPFQTKGVATVIADIETRATGVAEVLANRE